MEVLDGLTDNERLEASSGVCGMFLSCDPRSMLQDVARLQRRRHGFDSLLIAMLLAPWFSCKASQFLQELRQVPDEGRVAHGSTALEA